MPRLKSRPGRRLSRALLAMVAALAAACSSPPPAADHEALSLFLKARIAWGLGERAQSRALLQEAAKLAPLNAGVLVALAQANEIAGDEAAAYAVLEQALAAHPEDRAANLLFARLELRDHSPQQALDRLLGIEATGAADLEVYELLHPLLLCFGDAAQGLELFERANDRLPGHAYLLEARSDFLALLGREEEALRGYRRALALDPSRRSAELKAARLLEQQGDRALRRIAPAVGAGVGLPAAPRVAE
jgi:tetratricopeptide (TPR) repeat protein